MNSVMDNILVSICCLTYNHEKYIRECLEGFIMQKTSFKIEILVHDDASIDGTPNILREYADKYPNLFQLILQKENQYSQGISPLREWLFPRARGKYIAICEGDDYWIDPLKLQKQIDFMERHGDCYLTFHNAKIVNETQSLFIYKEIENRQYSLAELYENWIVPTASIIVVKSISSNFCLDSYRRLLNGDIFLVLSAAKVGKVFGMSDMMSVYRIQNNGLTLKREKEDNLSLQLRYINHYNYLRESFDIPLKLHYKKIVDTYINISIIYLKKADFRSVQYLFRAFFLSPIRFFVRLFNLLKK